MIGGSRSATAHAILPIWTIFERPTVREGESISRRAVIHCPWGTAREASAKVDQLRQVATKRGWMVVKVIVDRPKAGPREWAGLRQLLASSGADLLIVPSFAAIADTLPDVLEEILRLRDAGFDLYVHDAELDTTSPIDRVLFRIAEGLRSVEGAGATRSADTRGRLGRAKAFEPTPYQRSVIHGALSSGMEPRQVAKLLKVPLGLVQAVAKGK